MGQISTGSRQEVSALAVNSRVDQAVQKRRNDFFSLCSLDWGRNICIAVKSAMDDEKLNRHTAHPNDTENDTDDTI